MANFRSTADYLDSILLLSGEPINGNSAYEARTLHYLNRIHNALITGGNEFNIEVDEIWPWAVAKDPIILELQPKYDTGTISVTNGSNAVTLSVTTSSRAGWHIKFLNDDHYYKVESHAGGSAAMTLDGTYLGDTEAATTFELYKLDYEILPSSINLSDKNNTLVFSEANASTPLTIGDLKSNYSLSALASALKTALDAAGASTYTVTYDSVTRKYTIASDGAGADGVFKILGGSATESQVLTSILNTLGFSNKDYTGALTYTAERPVGAICKLTQPFKMHKGSGTGYKNNYGYHEIMGIDRIRFDEDYPITSVQRGDATRFTIIKEDNTGLFTVRFNRYVEDVKRVYVEYTPLPQDLADNTKSHPLIPRKYSQVLEYGAAAYLLAEKNDNRATGYFTLAGAVLESMVRNQRKQSDRTDVAFGEIIPRKDLMSTRRRRLIYGEPEG